MKEVEIILKLPPCSNCGQINPKVTDTDYCGDTSCVEIECPKCRKTVFSGMFHSQKRAIDEATKMWKG